MKPVGYKWMFVLKRYEKNEIVIYKARFAAQGFSERPGIDYEETYALMVNATTLRFLISLIYIQKATNASHGCHDKITLWIT